MAYRFIETIETAIYEWVKVQSGITVIWDKQDIYGSNLAVRPTKPYITLNLKEAETDIRKDAKYQGNGIYTVTQVKMIQVVIEIFSNQDGYYATLDKVRASLGFQSVLEILRAADLSFLNNTKIVDLSALISTQHEYRAQFEVMFQFALEYEDNTGIIEDVVVEYDLNAGQITGTFTVDT